MSVGVKKADSCTIQKSAFGCLATFSLVLDLGPLYYFFKSSPYFYHLTYYFPHLKIDAKQYMMNFFRSLDK